MTSLARELKRLGIHGLLHRAKLSVTFTAPAAGQLTATLTTTGRHPTVLATSRAGFAKAVKRTVTLTLARAPAARLRRAHHMRCTLTVRFAAAAGKAISVKSGVSVAT